MLRIKNLLIYILLIPFLFISLRFLLSIKSKIDNAIGQSNSRLTLNTKATDYSGEKIIYEVKLGNLYLGKAEFNNLSNVKLDNRLLNVITMETKLTQFTDIETIYSDPETFLPVRVERDVVKWFVREKISEDYDQNNFTVTIIKNKGPNQLKFLIKKESHIHNAILLPYYLRRISDLSLGKSIIVNLPTRKLQIKLVSIEELKLPAGIFHAYHFTSNPKQIDIWISADERRIPIKIESNGIFGYSMVMKEYSF